jgi:multifunctional beta-oxidation protein
MGIEKSCSTVSPALFSLLVRVVSGLDHRFLDLSLGATWTELPLIHEREASFQALPTFGAIPYFNSATPFSFDEILPNWDPTKLLHGEHKLEIRKFPIPTSATLVTFSRLLEVVDKRKAGVVRVGHTTRDAATGEDVFYNESVSYVRGSGGFSDGNSASSNQSASGSSVPENPPSQAPDFVREQRTTDEQAAIYRLNGDRNAMHIDPKTATKGGFSRPILHGLCFFGIAGKHVYERYGAFKSIRVRFAGTVDPGQTLRTEMWLEGDIVVFQMKVVDTGRLCISGGRAELWKGHGKEGGVSKL